MKNLLLGGHSGSHRAERVFLGQESSVLTNYSYSQTVDPNYSALIDIHVDYLISRINQTYGQGFIPNIYKEAHVIGYFLSEA